MLACLDHLVLAVADLDEARALYTRVLGRSPSWSGHHPALGTRNVLFRLENTYVELLAGAGEGAVGERLRLALGQRRERPFALALGVADLDSAVLRLRAAGLAVSDAAAGEGRDDASGARRTWRSAFLAEASVRGLRLFLIQHTSPAERLPPAAATASAGTLDAVDHVVIFTPDLDAARALWCDTLGLREAWRRDFAERGTRNLGLALGDLVVELIQRTDRPASGRGDFFWGVAYRSRDCDAAATRLRAAELPADEPRVGLLPATRVTTLRWQRTPTLVIGPG